MAVSTLPSNWVVRSSTSTHCSCCRVTAIVLPPETLNSYACGRAHYTPACARTTPPQRVYDHYIPKYIVYYKGVTHFHSMYIATTRP